MVVRLVFPSTIQRMASGKKQQKKKKKKNNFKERGGDIRIMLESQGGGIIR